MAINYKAPIDIRDNRNGNWFWVDKEVWADTRLTASDKVVYGSLAYFANNKSQTSFPSYTLLSKYSDVSERQCYRSIKKLEVLEYVSVKRGGGRGKPNIYALLENPAKMAEITETLTNKQKNPDKSSPKTLTNNTSNNTYINNTNKQEGNNLKKLNELRTSLKEKGIVKK
mgnify:CR=1 FL=1